MDIVLGHPLGDLAEIAADVGQARAGAQQVGGQGVAGLMSDVVAEVETVDPGAESGPEPVVGQRGRSVGVADRAGKQRHSGTFGAGRWAAVPGEEVVHGLALAFGQDLVESFGDADRGVVVADLGLVVPEHRQPAVAADAVPAHSQDLVDPPAGEHDGFPDVAHPHVLWVGAG